MRTLRALAILALGLFFFACRAWAQANVNESLETATLYVDTVNGSDTNPGTQSEPLKTIGAAAALAETNNQNGVGTLVVINPGTYRENISLTSTPEDTTLPVTFEAATNGSVIISGADVWTGWTAESGNPQIFTNSWPYQYGLCAPDPTGPPEQDIVLRREMIIVNGTPLTQVLSSNDLLVGAFSVDETNGIVYLWAPAGTDMSTATVEVATRSGLFDIQGKNDIVLRGLDFQYDNSCRGSGAVNVAGESSNILFDTDNFNWNNADGINLSNPIAYFTVENSTANHNGGTGFQSFDVDFGLWQNDQASFNNWRGAQGAYYTWNTSGGHFYGTHDSTFNGLTATYNQTHGIHWDYDNANNTSTSIVSSQNLQMASFIESSEGPNSISNSYFCNSFGGIAMRFAEGVTLTGDTIYNNTIGEIPITGTLGGISGVTNWETGQQYTLYTQNLTATGNTIEAVQGQQVFVDSYLGGSDWTNFATTLVSNNNTWWNATNSLDFMVPSPVPNTLLDFPGWQALTLQDLNSVWAAPSSSATAACQVTPDYPDYWFTIDNPSLTISPGAPAVFTATVTPLNFAGTVNLTSDGVQNIAGGSAAWSQNSISTAGSSTFTVSTGSTTPIGNYPIVLLGNSGNQTHTITVSVIVDNTAVVSPTSLTYANQAVGTTSAAQTVQLTNNGSASLSIASIALGGINPNDFAETDTCGTSLATGSSCTISVTFSPLAGGTLSASLTINDSAPSNPQTVSLTGTGTVPLVSFSPTLLTFAGTAVGTSSAPQGITLTNTGEADLSITGVLITGVNQSDYSQTNTCGTDVAAGASCTITVTFTPKISGTLTASVSVADNASQSPQTVPLTGTGTVPAVSFTPTSLTFPATPLGTSSAPQTLTLMNTGQADLLITSLSIMGGNQGDFSQTNTCGTDVAAGANCAITVTFTPKAAGARATNLSVADNAPGSPQKVVMTGTGTAPSVSFSPTSLTFPGTPVGTSSTPLNVTLMNAGSADLLITTVSITGVNQSEYTQTNTCGTDVAAGASCTITVTFTPKGSGTRTASVSVTDNATGSPQKVTMTGTGTVPTVTFSPTSLTFPGTPVGTTSAPLNLTLTNTGQANLSITSVSITGVNQSEYSQTNTCGTTVAAGANCTFTVTFTPKASGTRTASVSVTDNAAGSPQKVTLTGTGETPSVSFSPTSLTFPGTPVGTTSAPQNAILTNTGQANLAITKVSITGVNQSEYSQTNTCGTSVAAGANCTITVTFTPKASGTRTASVSVTDNAAGSPQKVTLTGTATAPAVSLSPATLTFASQKVGTTSPPKNVTLTNTGTAILSITSIKLTGTNISSYAETNTCGASVSAGASCTITVTFTPKATGTKTADVSVTDNASGSPQKVAMTGTGS